MTEERKDYFKKITQEIHIGDKTFKLRLPNAKDTLNILGVKNRLCVSLGLIPHMAGYEDIELIKDYATLMVLLESAPPEYYLHSNDQEEINFYNDQLDPEEIKQLIDKYYEWIKEVGNKKK